MATRNDITGDELRSKLSNKNFEDNFDAIFRKKKEPLNEYPDNGNDPEKWDEARVDVVGSNGNTGEHYEELKDVGE